MARLSLNRIAGASAVLAASLAPGAGAQEPAPAPAATALEPVVITATRTERLLLDVPASIELIDGSTIRDGRLRVNLSETLGRVPGLVVLDRQNYAQDLQISIRGFGSRSTFGVRGVRLNVDGVPATFADGQGQVSHFPLNAAERVEVLRGPFSALYGNSSGGVIALATELKPQPNRFTLSGAGGSNGMRRFGLNAVGGAGENAFAIDASRFETDGARQHSAALRDSLSLRTAFLDSPLGAVRLSLNSVAMPDAQDPLGLTRAQYEADPAQAAPVAVQFNTRKTTRQQTAGAEVRSALAPWATLTTALWAGRRSVTQFQAIAVATQANPTQPGGVIDLERGFGGADVRATVEAADWTHSVGLAYERVGEDRRGYENFVDTGLATVLGVQGNLRRDERNRIESFDVYAQTERRAGPRWRLHAGARGTEIRFRSRDRYIVGVNGDDSGARRFAAVNPTVGAVYRWRPAVALHAAYGRGFETPTLNELAYRSDGSAGFNDALRSARSDNVEVGAKFSWPPTLTASLAAFSIRSRDEIVVRANAGGRSSFGNAARTERDGVEASLHWRPTPALSATAALSALRARFGSDFLACGPPPCITPSLPVAAGNRLPGVPERTAFLELKYRALWADLSAEVQARSAIAVDDRNTDRAAGYALVNLVLARSFSAGAAQPRAFARLDNVADRRHVGSVIVNESNARFFEPGPGRTWLIGLDWPL